MEIAYSQAWEVPAGPDGYVTVTTFHGEEDELLDIQFGDDDDWEDDHLDDEDDEEYDLD